MLWLLASNSISEHNLLTDLTVGQILAVLTTLLVIIGFIKTFNPIMHRLSNMLDDWNGEPGRPGVPERKGVMQRLGAQDEAINEVRTGQSEQDEVLSHLRKKVEPLVDETMAGNHQEVLHKLDEIVGTTHDCGTHLSRVEHLLHRHIRESKQWVQAVDEKAREVDFIVPPWPDLPTTSRDSDDFQ